MPVHRTPTLLPHVLALFTAARPACAQTRTWQRLVLLSLGWGWALGRHTLSQVIVAVGGGEDDWTSWYRLFSAPRVQMDVLQRQLVWRLVRRWPQARPLVVVLDATHLPRSSRRMPGVGWARCPRTPPWARGIHLAQRWVGLNALLPRSATGDSRALPLRWTPAVTPKATPLDGHPAQTEWQAGLALLTWLRTVLGARRPILVVADGAYSTAKLWSALPARTTLFARCARNRALYRLPPVGPRRGRPRKYGPRWPSPQQILHQEPDWQTRQLTVRGRRRSVAVLVQGPVLVRPAATVPLFLIVVRGTKQHAPLFALVNARRTASGRWVLPYPLTELLAWAWQRWEVEVMHRELKSGFGLGQPQAWTATGTVTTTQWGCWVYAVVVLAAYRAWGHAPPPGASPGRWWPPRRWSLGTVGQQLRAECWQLGDFQPLWGRSPDTWAEMTAWLAAQTNVLRGYRRI